MAQRLLDTKDEPGWIWDMRKLVGAVRAELVDVRFGEFSKLLAPDDYSASQAFARYHGKGGKDGIAYPSVRHPGREFISPSGPMSSQNQCRRDISVSTGMESGST